MIERSTAGVIGYKKWDSLPLWARWVLCWPAIILFSLVGIVFVNWLAETVLLDRFFLSGPAARILFQSIMALYDAWLFFTLLYLFIPWKQIWFIGIFAALTNLLVLMSIILWWYYVSTQDHMAFADLIKYLLQTTTIIAIDWYWFFYYRGKISEQRELKQSGPQDTSSPS